MFEFVHPVTFVPTRVQIPGGIWKDTNLLVGIVQDQLGEDSFVRVDFDCNKRLFVFRSDRPFALDFSVHSPTARLFGFEPQRYEGQAFYRSLRPARFGFLLPQNSYAVEHVSKQNKYMFVVRPSSLIAIRSIARLQIESDVHGLSVGDVVRFAKYGSAVVTSVLSPTVFEVHTVPSTEIQEFVVDEPASLNLYLSKPPGSRAVHSRYLGFPPATIETQGAATLSEYIIDVTPVKYVLFDITTPEGSTRVETSSGTENRCVVGKIIMKPKIKLDRIDTMSLDVTGLAGVNQVHIRILNPDFSLYHFHGADWSGSLLLSTLQVVPQLVAN